MWKRFLKKLQQMFFTYISETKVHTELKILQVFLCSSLFSSQVITNGFNEFTEFITDSNPLRFASLTSEPWYPHQVLSPLSYRWRQRQFSKSFNSELFNEQDPGRALLLHRVCVRLIKSTWKKRHQRHCTWLNSSLKSTGTLNQRSWVHTLVKLHCPFSCNIYFKLQLAFYF